jgi:uncharacterized FlaG/YvyC family protein
MIDTNTAKVVLQIPPQKMCDEENKKTKVKI